MNCGFNFQLFYTLNDGFRASTIKNQVLFLLHYLVAMCACIPQKKITVKEPFTLEIWAAQDLTINYFLLWAGLSGATDRGAAALVNHTVRVEYG